MPQLLSENSRAHERKLLKTTHLEPVIYNKRNRCTEKTAHHKWRVALPFTAEEGLAQQQRPSTARHKRNTQIFKQTPFHICSLGINLIEACFREMNKRIGNLRGIMYKESWMPKNWRFWTVVLEKTLKSPLDYKEIQPVHPKGDQSWMFIGRTDAETPILWTPDANWLIGKRPGCWERLKARGEGDNRGWDCWMTSPTRWTWVWVSSGSWWWTGKPGMLQSMGLQRVGHDWATELNWTEYSFSS